VGVGTRAHGPRPLLDRVSTELLALDGKGGARHFADYAQWEAGQAEAREPEDLAPRSAAPPLSAPDTSRPLSLNPTRAPRKLGYLEQREWDQIESKIQQAEQELAACERAASDPAIASDHQALTARLAALAAAHAEVETLYARWAELEAKTKP